MNTTTNSKAIIAGLSRFFNEVCSALFVSPDKKDYQRWKDFLAH
jgi:hypothetical protein